MAGTAQQHLEGTIQRVLFKDDSTLKCGFWLETVDGQNVKVIGEMHNPTVGAKVRVEGKHTVHQKHGPQVDATMVEMVLPQTANEIVAYLQTIPGVGPVTAKRMVERFGPDKVFQVLRSEPHELVWVRGLKPHRAQKIHEHFLSMQPIHDIMVFLRKIGLGASLSVKVYKALGGDKGENVAAKIQQNPYLLSMVDSIGFKRADEAAKRLGFTAEALERMRAGVQHAMSDRNRNGHTRTEFGTLVELANDTLLVGRPKVSDGIRDLCATGDAVATHGNNGETYVAMPAIEASERRIAQEVLRLASGKPLVSQRFDAQALARESGFQGHLDPAQADAIVKALTSKFSVLTGGPGMGKTAICKVIVKAAQKHNLKLCLTTPTGRAAVRLADATGHDAKTIHRLLGLTGTGAAVHTEKNPLDAHLIICDEMSMVDVYTFAKLLRAIPSAATVILVGDVDQLPSVGPGNVLRDIIKSGLVPVSRLTKVFRQGAGSGIALGAQAIIQGIHPKYGDDFRFREHHDPEALTGYIVRLVTDTIRAMDDLNAIQVLCPRRKDSPIGADTINYRIQSLLRAGQPMMQVGQRNYAVGDKLLQTRNNYDLGVFNGDMGVVKQLDPTNKRLVASFNDENLVISGEELFDLDLAYAISIHKSQGGQFPAVIVPIHQRDSYMLSRNLLYTAVTRAERKLELVGTEKGIWTAIQSTRNLDRDTGLGPALIEESLKAFQSAQVSQPTQTPTSQRHASPRR